MKNQIKIAVPIIDLRDMRLPQRVLDRKRMKVEDAAEPVFDVGVRVSVARPLDIDPDQSGCIAHSFFDASSWASCCAAYRCRRERRRE